MIEAPSLELTILQTMRNNARRQNNERLAAALSLAINEQIGLTDNTEIIADEINAYQNARRNAPRLQADVSLVETSRDDDGTIVLAVVPT
jgi:hypothetical protein